MPTAMIVLSYHEHQPQALPLPDVAKAPLAAQDSTDEAWFIWNHLEQYHASRSPFDYYLRGVALDPLDYRCNLALAMLEYNRADFPAIGICQSGTKETRTCAEQKSAVRTGESLIRASAYERQGQYQQAEEDFWRAVWSGNSKAGGYYGLARLAARNGNFDAGLDFCQQSLRACPTNQEVLCLHNLLLVLSGRQDNARLQREKLLRDYYPLNATLVAELVRWS